MSEFNLQHHANETSKALELALDKNEYLTLKNQELMAQVELLKQAVSTVRLAGKVGGFAQQSLDSAKAERLAWFKLNEACQLTPAQCLAEVKAQVSKSAIHWALGAWGNQDIDYTDIQKAAEDYANQLRQQAKGGEL